MEYFSNAMAITESLLSQGLTHKEAAELIQVSPCTFARMVNCNTLIRSKMASKLRKAFGKDAVVLKAVTRQEAAI